MKYYSLCIPLLLVSMIFFASLAKANDFSATERTRMSVFISNFSELGMTNVHVTAVKDTPDLYLGFGIWHNFINNYSSRIQPVAGNNNGLVSIPVKYIQESLKKYFDISITTWPSTEKYSLKDDAYVFTGASGELVVHAKVTKAVEQTADKHIIMTGYYYNADEEDEIYGTFTAVSKPHVWHGKKTWALISLESKDKE